MLQSKLQPFFDRYNELTELLSAPDITSDIKKMTELSKEQSSLLPIVEKEDWRLYKRDRQMHCSLEQLAHFIDG